MFKEVHIKSIRYNPVAQYSAGFRPRLKNGHLIAIFGQLGRTAQTARTGAHNRYFFGSGLRLCKYLEASFPGMFDQKSLDFTDPDGALSPLGAILRFKHRTALLLAELRCRTKNAAGASHDIVFFNRAYGARNIFKPQFADKFSRLGIGRTSLGAGRIMAKQAAIRLGNRLGQIEPLAYCFKFVKITHNTSSLRVTIRPFV
jgi:hypothetical protein